MAKHTKHLWGIAAAALAGGLVISCASTDGEHLGSLGEELATVASCPAGYNIIEGTSGDDVLNGTTGNDCILGYGGNDIINGDLGNDYLFGGIGVDTIHGNDGNDVIYGETGDDQLFGDAGGDSIFGGLGDDTISGGDAADNLNGEIGNDTITGDAGDDAIYGAAGIDTLSGGDGNDTIDGGDGNDILNGGIGNDILYGRNDNDTLNGDAGNDLLYGGPGDDELHGGIGDDTLRGEDGNDQLFGEDGNDRLVGGLGVDIIDGGPGNDLTNEGANNGPQLGQDGNDVLFAGGAADGGPGFDACSPGQSCEFPVPAVTCTTNAQCGTGQRCATEVGYCIYCQANSECTGGVQCIPTLGCANKEVSCTDGIDNDEDTLIDCADPDCANQSVCQTLGGGGHKSYCVATPSGKVQCWGKNNCGQLGYGTTSFRSTDALTVPGITTAKQVRVGNLHACALLADGTVWCWGSSSAGQRGDGIIANNPCVLTPKQVGSVNNVPGPNTITNAIALTASGAHSCALLSTGQIKCWGDNAWGTLGDGTAVTTATPVLVSGITNAVAVESGIQHACALLADRTVRCWGRNHTGQVGDGTTTARVAPVQVATGVAQIAAGQDFTCARLIGGQVYCWGRGEGRLGNGGTANSLVPVAVNGITDAVLIDLGWSHSCAIRSGANGMRCWGTNTTGELGLGTIGGTALTPVGVPINNATGLALGLGSTCAMRAGNTLWCWGDNDEGQLGRGGTDLTPSGTPKQITTYPAP